MELGPQLLRGFKIVRYQCSVHSGKNKATQMVQMSDVISFCLLVMEVLIYMEIHVYVNLHMRGKSISGLREGKKTYRISPKPAPVQWRMIGMSAGSLRLTEMNLRPIPQHTRSFFFHWPAPK